jgi:hypothetical protein
MSIPTTRSGIDRLDLSLLSPEILTQKKQRQKIHHWIREELNTISYVRLHRKWTWSQIQRTLFSSMSVGSVKVAFLRLPPDERIRRASIVSSRNKAIEHSRVGKEENLALSHTADPTQSKLGAVPDALPSQARHKYSINNNTARYNLRPNRPTDFKENQSRYLVDRRRFPYFATSCRKYSKLRNTHDEDYFPPSHSPTPDLSDRSHSVTSSTPTDASSLDLFGLEVRSVNSSSHPSPVTSSPLSNRSISEFFSADQDPTTS